jgi:hypothetical protein
MVNIQLLGTKWIQMVAFFYGTKLDHYHKFVAFIKLPGLNPTISKNIEKSCFLKFYTDKFFLGKQKKFPQRFLGATSWQDFCIFYANFS